MLLATLENAAWSWWVRPLLVRNCSPVWVSSIARMGTNRVHALDPQTGAHQALKLGGRDQVDDHNAGAIAYHRDRPTLLVFYARHATDNHIRWRHVNRTTLNVSADERRLGFPGRVTYAQILQNGDTLTVLCRADASWVYRESTDWGVRWGPYRVLVDARSIGQPYVIAAPDPLRPHLVHCTVSGNPGSTSYREVRGLLLDLDAREARTLGGGRLGSLDADGGPNLTPDRLDVLHDPGAGRRCRVLDLTGTADGSPRVVLAEWEGREGPAEYRVISPCEAPAWRLPSGREIGHTVAAHYVGGAAWLPDGGLLTSRRVEDDDGAHSPGTWVVEQWGSALAGRPWGVVATSRAPLCRPVATPHPDPGGGFLAGLVRFREYGAYTQYDADVEIHRLPEVPA